ncbi:MAG: RNA-binding protein [Ignavibacteriaceae bacterium]|nr:RNA-binding protein [Ignavibacteriaceae bacterium]MCU0364103.1 RNA-binding protein [Ignavibacteriaceae bacterium]MCU0405608.1 RNA-binding protein [Ignavibacteriaceae bacterium]MCU0412823.1 RNA-binding protein [Ignavibacteriaceae bacterium]
MSKKLFVGSLPWAVNDEGLKQAFTPYGKVVSATVVVDRRSGRSKGFGFVEMENDSEAKAAIEALNGSELNGRNIVVNEAKPKEKE